MNYRVIPSIFGSMDQTSRPHSSKKHIYVFGKQYDLCHLVFSLKLLVKKSPWYVSETYGKYSKFMLVLSQNHGTEFICYSMKNMEV